MTELQQMMDRNQRFAAQYQGDLTIMPRFATMVLTCSDARIDPAHFLGLDLGDALVFRDAGARITAEIELEIGVLWAMAQKMAGEKFTGWKLAIIHHTDCGFERLANPELATVLSQRLAVEKSTIDKMGIHDHIQHMRDDIVRLRKSPVVPDQLVVSGHIYDVDSGLVQEVVAPTPLSLEKEPAL